MAMAMGLGRIMLIVGAGYGGTVYMKNGKISDILAELQKLVKKMESTEGGNTGSDTDSDAIAAQIRRLASEVRNMGNSRQIIVSNGDSSRNMSALAMPCVALGFMGYGYMWWKGLSLSDLMYVTKRGMTAAVSNMTQHLEKVSVALESTKKHLTQRIMNLDGKLDDQKEMSKQIKDEVEDVRNHLTKIGFDVSTINHLMSCLGDKILSLEEKQDIANEGLWHLVNFVNIRGGGDINMTKYLEGLPKPATKARGFFGFTETPSLKGLAQIADSFTPGNKDKSSYNISVDQDAWRKDSTPKNLTRSASVKK